MCKYNRHKRKSYNSTFVSPVICKYSSKKKNAHFILKPVIASLTAHKGIPRFLA